MEKIWKEKNRFTTSRSRYFITKIETMKIERKKRSATFYKESCLAVSDTKRPWEKQKDLCRIFCTKLYKKFSSCRSRVNVQLPNYSNMPISINKKPIAMAEFWWGDSPKSRK